MLLLLAGIPKAKCPTEILSNAVLSEIEPKDKLQSLERRRAAVLKAEDTFRTEQLPFCRRVSAAPPTRRPEVPFVSLIITL